MKILVKADPLDAFDTSVNCLLVELDEQTVKELLDRRELLQMVKSRDKRTHSLGFWGIPGEFHALGFEATLGEELASRFVDSEFLIMEDAFEIKYQDEDEGPIRVESHMMVVTERGFSFFAGVRHGSWVESRELQHELLLESLKNQCSDPSFCRLDEDGEDDRLCGICGKSYEKCDCAETGRR